MDFNNLFREEMPNFDILLYDYDESEYLKGETTKKMLQSDETTTTTTIETSQRSSDNTNKQSTEMPRADNGKRKASVVILEDNDIEEFQVQQVAKNTVKGTEVAVRRLKNWHNERYGETLVLNKLTKANTNQLLKHFFLEIRDTRNQTLGEEYEPSTLQTYRNGLRRYFLERKEGEKFDIGDDNDLKKKLAAKKKQLKADGKGNRPFQADPLDENQIEKLWNSGAVGLKTPRQLLNLVWWNNIRMLGMRAQKEQLDCKIQDFQDRKNYYEYTERSTKSRSGEKDNLKARRKYNNKIFRGDGSGRDPYLALQSYLKHRPEGVDAFYLQPIDNPKGQIWYKTLILRKDGLGNIMKRMAELAEIQDEGRFTNSSGRKTSIQTLHGHFDPLAISELTGHANPSSIQSYSHNSISTQREMFERLSAYLCYLHSGQNYQRSSYCRRRRSSRVFQSVQQSNVK